MIDVLCWKWKPAPNYRSRFTAAHVNTLAAMVARNYAGPHRVTCVTDDAEGIDRNVRVLPLWDDFAQLKSPHDAPGRRPNPACYRRLRMFAADAPEWLGRRVLSIDLDVVITGDLAPLVERPEPIVLWGDTSPGTFYNGGMVLFDAGAFAHIWDDFRANPQAQIAKAQKLRQWGSDQGVIGAALGPGRPIFRTTDGVYSYRNHIRKAHGRLPQGARLVSFHGEFDPWGDEAQRLDWVRENWR